MINLTSDEVAAYCATVGLTPAMVLSMRMAERVSLLQAVGQAKLADALVAYTASAAISAAEFSQNEAALAGAAEAMALAMAPPRPA
jgi:hypothetical protein